MTSASDRGINMRLADIQELSRKRNLAWRINRDKLITRVRKLHPETNGHLGMVHNWGNEAARQAVTQADARWHRFAAYYDKRISDAIAAYGKGN